MIKRATTAILLSLLFVLSSGVVADQTGYRPPNEFGEARFAVDAVDFRSDEEGINVMEIYYKIFYDALGYQKTNDGYVAAYEVAIVVEGEDNKQIEGFVKSGEIKVKTYAETRRHDDFIINVVTLAYAPQDVHIRATLSDKSGNLMAEADKKLDKREYWGKYPRTSRVEFAREIETGDRPSKFKKGNFRVIPSVSRLFGGEGDSLMSFYYEIYPGRTTEKYTKVIIEMDHRHKGKQYADTIEVGEITEMRRETHTLDATALYPGDYELKIRIEGRRGRDLDELTSDVELELTAESMFTNDYEVAVDMLKYLATRGERKKLEAAKTPEERRRIWNEFWGMRTAEGNDRVNPTKSEYFRRVRHANRYFSFMKKDGWKTTRGMIYITYGTPDDVEDYPFELASKPYQVWLYYRLSPARKFLFIDEWGDGNYELQPPYNGLDF